MNKKQIIVAWVGGLILAIIIFITLNRLEYNFNMVLVRQAVDKGMVVQEQMWFTEGNPTLAIIRILKIGLCFITIGSFLIYALRDKKK